MRLLHINFDKPVAKSIIPVMLAGIVSYFLMASIGHYYFNFTAYMFAAFFSIYWAYILQCNGQFWKSGNWKSITSITVFSILVAASTMYLAYTIDKNFTLWRWY